MQRPKYSTGFRVFLAGLTIAAIGALGIAYGAKSFGGVLLVAGLLISIPFKYQSDWRRTWPDDFPIVARLFGREPHPERWVQTPTVWETAPASSRRTRSLVLIVVGAVFFGWGARNPTNFNGYPSHAGGVAIGAAAVALGVVQLRRAMRDSHAD